MRRIFHDSGRFTQNLEVGGSRVFLVGTRGGNHLAGKLIIRRIVGDLGANPFAELRSALGAEELAVDLKQVSPLIGPVVNIITAAHQLVD